MPLPRYENLSQEKKDQLRAAAMNEFSRYPYQDASINRIISNSGFSKGTMYYYFSDKADLYGDLIESFITDALEHWPFDRSVKSARKYWKEWDNVYKGAYEYFGKSTEALNLYRNFVRLISSGTAPQQALIQWERLSDFNWDLISLGKEIGAVRVDLADSLLRILVDNLIRSFDLWTGQTFRVFDPNRSQELSNIISELMKRLFSAK